MTNHRLRVSAGVGVAACCLVVVACGSAASPIDEELGVVSSEVQSSHDCDSSPTGVATSDYFLDFTIPAGLMPNAKFDGRAARIEVHRVQPVYARGKCASVKTSAAVLVHGRTIPGSVGFDHRRRHDAAGTPSVETGELSLQENLARSGIDTFAPNLLGYGRSTRFADGLDDPCNASLRPYTVNPESGQLECVHPEGCDFTTPLNPPDQQGTTLATVPLASGRCPHSTDTRFARVDVWVRDIRHVVDDAIAKAAPSDGQVTLIGSSAGAARVGRALYHSPRFDAILHDDIATVREKTNRVVFLSPLLLGPDEEPVDVDSNPANGPFFTFPLHLAGRSTDRWDMPLGREAVCTGHGVPKSSDEQWSQTLALDPLGSTWSGTAGAGANRTPTFSTYGFNATTGAKIEKPTLVLQGLDDNTASVSSACALFDNLATNDKVLVELDCASHAMIVEGCSGERCERHGKPAYGAQGHEPWAGPYRTIQTAIVEWIEDGKFDHKKRGKFLVDTSGVARKSDGVCVVRPPTAL